MYTLHKSRGKGNIATLTSLSLDNKDTFIQGCCGIITKMYEGPRHRTNYGCNTLLVYLNKRIDKYPGLSAPLTATFFCIQTIGKIGWDNMMRGRIARHWNQWQ